MTEIQKHLDAISQNRLMLKLWQSGRELFHSNMLAFILEAGQQSKLLSYLWGAPWGDDYPHIRVLREYKHMDLWVISLPKLYELDPDTSEYWDEARNRIHKNELKPWRLIVIENKFKSLPNKPQLKRYEKNLPFCRIKGFKTPAQKVRSLRKDWISRLDTGGFTESDSKAENWLYEKKCIILVPTVPEETEVMFSEPWEIRTWHDIQLKIDCDNYSSSLESLFIYDYRKILESACELHLHHFNIIKEKFSIGDNVKKNAFRLRLHDFVDKWRYEWLAQEIISLYENLQPCSLQLSTGRKEFDGYRLDNNSSCWLVIEPFFSRGSGGVDLCVHVPTSNKEQQPFAMGVQLQGNVLKIFVIQDIASDKSRTGCHLTTAKITAAAVINYLVKEINKDTDYKFECNDGNSNSSSGLGKYDQVVSLLKWNNENQLENWYIDQPSTKGSFIYQKWNAWDSESKHHADDLSKESKCFANSWGDYGMRDLAKEIKKIFDVLCSNLGHARSKINNPNNDLNH